MRDWTFGGRSRDTAVTLVVIAKAPVPGQAKTRLAATVGDEAAADIAAATLLDTLDAVDATPVQARVVALTGDLDQASSGAEIRSRLADFTVVEQRGDDFSREAGQRDRRCRGGGGRASRAADRVWTPRR